MFAKLSALVGSGNALPFEITEEYGMSWGQWTHCGGVMTSDGQKKVSVFRISGRSEMDQKIVAARNGVKRLKMVGGCFLVGA